MKKNKDRYLVSVNINAAPTVVKRLNEMQIEVNAAYDNIDVLVISIEPEKFEEVLDIPEVLYLEREKDVYL